MSTILITGASWATARRSRHFHAEGWNIIATMRKPAPGVLPESDRMRLLPLDVADEASIAAYVAAAGPWTCWSTMQASHGRGVRGLAAARYPPHLRHQHVRGHGNDPSGLAGHARARQRRGGKYYLVGDARRPFAAPYTASKAAIEGFSRH